MTDIRHTLTLVSLLCVTSASARLPITIGQIDSLLLPYSLPKLTEFLKALPENDPDVVKRKLDVVRSFFALRAGKEELGLQLQELNNLRAIWELNIKLAEKGEITDLQLLDSENSLLSKRAALIGKEKECRNYLLEIARLALLRIDIEKHEAQKKAHSASD